MLSLYEDLWDVEDSETGCTDIAATGKATSNGKTLLGHNNDWDPDVPAPTVLVFKTQEGPVVTALAAKGAGISVGVNSYGVVLTGNQLSAYDVKAGIPRILLVRAALQERSIKRAGQVLMNVQRASSYNNILADEEGGVVSIEGSGTGMGLIVPNDEGLFAHTNHYQHPALLPIEIKDDMKSTHLRADVAFELLKRGCGKHSPETFVKILRNHHGYPISICRHGSDATTGFSVVFEPQDRKLWVCEGNPCEGDFELIRY